MPIYLVRNALPNIPFCPPENLNIRKYFRNGCFLLTYRIPVFEISMPPLVHSTGIPATLVVGLVANCCPDLPNKT
jgi:hypothetical protein